MNSSRCPVSGTRSISLNCLSDQYCAKRSTDSIWLSGECCSISLFHCSRPAVLWESMRRDSTTVTPQSTTQKRAKLTIQQLKVPLLVDSKENAVLDLHVRTTRKHDSQIAPSLIKRNPETTTSYLGTKATTTRKSDGLSVNTRFVQ